MSVLLTATRKSVCKEVKSKSAKGKAKQKHTVKSFNPTPPVSSPETTVWHWQLDNRPVTIMFNKSDESIWCNGQVIETEMAFGDDDGALFEFELEVKDGTCHVAQIKRVASGDKREAFIYKLFVDDIMILEHRDSQPF